MSSGRMQMLLENGFTDGDAGNFGIIVCIVLSLELLVMAAFSQMPAFSLCDFIKICAIKVEVAVYDLRLNTS